jgi:tetratricopeptide (TPR) repeat protein
MGFSMGNSGGFWEQWRESRRDHHRRATRAYRAYLRKRRRANFWTLAFLLVVLITIGAVYAWHSRYMMKPLLHSQISAGSKPYVPENNGALSGGEPTMSSSAGLLPGGQADSGREVEIPAAEPVGVPKMAEPNPEPMAPAPLAQIGRSLKFVREAEQSEMNMEWRKALDQYRTALDIWPALGAVYPRIGRIYLRLGQVSNAVAYFERALEYDPSTRQRFEELADALLLQRSNARCEEVLKTLLPLGGTDAGWAHFRLGKLAMQESDIEGALQHFDEFFRAPIEEFTEEARESQILLYMLQEQWARAEGVINRQLAEPQGRTNGTYYMQMAACRASQADLHGTLDWLEHGKEFWDAEEAERWLAQPFFKSVQRSPIFQEWLDGREKATMENSEESSN